MLLARLCMRYPNVLTGKVHRFHSLRSEQIAKAHKFRFRALPILAGATLGGIGIALSHEDVGVDSDNSQAAKVPISSFIRAYIVYTLCGFPDLVDRAPLILSTALNLPVIGPIALFVVRHTFFAQFVGGDTAEETLTVIKHLRSQNTGVLLVNSVEEEDQSERSHIKKISKQDKEVVKEVLRAIDAAADFENEQSRSDKTDARSTWVGVKMTALLANVNDLRRFSDHLSSNRPDHCATIPYPGCPHTSDMETLTSSASELTSMERTSLYELYTDMRVICKRARSRNVRIAIDAEQSWYQPAIDAISLALMQEFNVPSTETRGSGKQMPLVYTTYQAYLRRTEQYLKQSLSDAASGGYSLGVKLVRGAYHDQESKRQLPLQGQITGAPVWDSKIQTDECFNACVRLLINRIAVDIKHPASNGARVAALFGTHNVQSCDLVYEELVANGLASKEDSQAPEMIRVERAVTDRVAIAQLYGMCDSLSNNLRSRVICEAPLIYKYLPYGALKEVMPYLSRRAIENKTVLGNGGAANERQYAYKEIKRRLFGPQCMQAMVFEYMWD